jgi:hypothetical protein
MPKNEAALYALRTIAVSPIPVIAVVTEGEAPGRSSRITSKRGTRKSIRAIARARRKVENSLQPREDETVPNPNLPPEPQRKDFETDEEFLEAKSSWQHFVGPVIRMAKLVERSKDSPPK